MARHEFRLLSGLRYWIDSDTGIGTFNDRDCEKPSTCGKQLSGAMLWAGVLADEIRDLEDQLKARGLEVYDLRAKVRELERRLARRE